MGKPKKKHFNCNNCNNKVEPRCRALRVDKESFDGSFLLRLLAVFEYIPLFVFLIFAVACFGIGVFLLLKGSVMTVSSLNVGVLELSEAPLGVVLILFSLFFGWVCWKLLKVTGVEVKR